MDIMNFIYNVPSYDEDFIFRKNLINIFHKNLKKTVILVKAPLGYGKTVFLSQIFYEINYKKIWITCPEFYFDFSSLLNHIFFSLNSSSSDLIPFSLKSLNEKTAEIIDFLSSLKEDIYIFIDSFENILFDEYEKKYLLLLINFSGKNVHYIFGTNKDFPVPILKNINKIKEIGKNELKFTDSETKKFFDGTKIKNYDSAEGYPLMLNLIKMFPGNSKNYTEEYFSFIIKNFNSDEQNFIEIISLMNNISYDFLKKYFRDPSSADFFIKKSEDLNIITQSENGLYHTVKLTKTFFSEKINSERKKSLYKKISEIFKNLGETKNEFYYLTLLNDPKEVSLFFLSNSDFLVKDYPLVNSWFEKTEEKFFNSDYNLYYYKGLIKEKYFFFDEALKNYKIALKNINFSKNSKITKNTIEIRILGIYWHKEDYKKVIKYYEKIIKKIPDNDYISEISVFNIAGTSYINLSDYKNGEKLLIKALELCEKNNVNDMKPWILNNLAYNLYYPEGHIEKTEETYIKALLAFKENNDIQGETKIYANLTDFYTETANYKKAHENIKKYTELSNSANNNGNFLSINLLNAKLNLYTKNKISAGKNIETLDKNIKNISEFIKLHYLVIKALYFAETENPEKSIYYISGFSEKNNFKLNGYKYSEFMLKKVYIFIKLKNYHKALEISSELKEDSEKKNYLIILTECLFLKFICLKTLNIHIQNDEKKLFISLIKKNNYYYISSKYKEYSEFFEQIMNNRITIGYREKTPQELFKNTKKIFPEIFFFGEFRINFGENEINEKTIKNKKSFDLFKYLIFNKDREIFQETITEIFWPDLSYEKARQNLYVALHDIRKEFKKVGLSEKYILSGNKKYNFNSDLPYYFDYEAFIFYFDQAQYFYKNKFIIKSKEYYLQAKNIYKKIDSNFVPLYDWESEKMNYSQDIFLKILLKLFETENDINQKILFLEDYIKINRYSDYANRNYIKILYDTGNQRKSFDYFNLTNKIYNEELGTYFTKDTFSDFIKKL